MSLRFPCCVPRWHEDWNRAARDLDPGFQRRKRARQDGAIRQSNERLRRLVEEAKRARREDYPTVN